MAKYFFSAQRFFVFFVMMTVTGCSCFHPPGFISKFLEGSDANCQDKEDQIPPMKAYVYFDRKVYVYQKDYLFDMLDPQMKRGFEKLMKPVVDYAMSNPNFVISIRSFGDDAKNSSFSTEQIDFEAEAVAAYLWTQGLSNEVRFEGFGQGKHSVSSNRVAKIGRENRRVEIEFADEIQKY